MVAGPNIFSMPKPPIIQSAAGQRAVIAALMGLLLALSMAAAYALSRTSPARQAHYASHHVGSWRVALPDRWQPQEPGAWSQLLQSPNVFADAERPSRLLVIGSVQTTEPTSPKDVVERLVGAVVQGPVQPRSQYLWRDPELPRVEFCLTQPTDDGRVIQHQFAAVAVEPNLFTVFYMRDVVDDQGTFQQNQLEFQRLHLSMQG